MLRLKLAAGGGAVGVSGSNLTWVVVVAVIALLALAVAGWLVREVLAASQGTEKMQEIARAVQEGAAAYLRRQFRTIGIFVVPIFFVLLLLPADTASVRWGRSACARRVHGDVAGGARQRAGGRRRARGCGG
jgi:K(+)-stimulated pyrophosphate-energized sodium pump